MFPRQVKLFVPWAKAMVQGATVDKPNYGKNAPKSGKASSMRKRKRRRRRRKRNAKKE